MEKAYRWDPSLVIRVLRERRASADTAPSLTPASGEDDNIALSALQHYLFCPRQCALIHVEQTWSENRFTAEGRVLHETTSQVASDRRKGVRVVSSMPLASKRLRVTGIADLVELHEMAGKWRPYPVEYKRAKPKSHRADEVQLCAQAMCLEEMFGVELPEGALFYGEPRRRTLVAIDAPLRALTIQVANDAHAMIAAARTPTAIYERKRCESCSLKDDCRPRQLARIPSVAPWRLRQIAED